MKHRFTLLACVLMALAALIVPLSCASVGVSLFSAGGDGNLWLLIVGICLGISGFLTLLLKLIRRK